MAGDVVNVRVFGASPSASSAVNAAAFAAAFAAGDEVVAPRGVYDLGAGPLTIPSGKTFRGAGFGTVLKFSGADVAVAIGDGSASTSRVNARDFRIVGSGTTALKVNKASGVEVDGVSLDGAGVTGGSAWTDGFVFVTTWSSRFANLATNGATITGACFTAGAAYNANVASNWYTSNTSATHNILIDRTVGGGASAHGNHFSMITAQGGLYGLYVRAHSDAVFNGVYTENVVKPLVFGERSASALAVGIAVHGASLGGPYVSHPQRASRLAAIEVDYAAGVWVAGVNFSGAYGAGSYAPVSFSGGGGTGAEAVARVTVDGAVHSIEVIRFGSGYTEAPTVTIGGAGSGATATATLADDKVTSVAVNDAGTGYIPTTLPVAIRYNRCGRVSISGGYFNDGEAGLVRPLYPWVVRATGADSAAGIRLLDDTSRLNSGDGNSADLVKTRGLNYRHALVESDATGERVIRLYTPPQFP